MPVERNKPILFSAPMVRAILSDAKTQTRRVVKPQPPDGFSPIPFPTGTGTWAWQRAASGRGHHLHVERAGEPFRCPYGAPGDTLWVRETWRADDFDPPGTIYAADHPEAVEEARGIIRWRPSIHMPRARARVTLRVTSVRVERLHAITEDDARAEGIASPSVQTGPHALLGRPLATEFGALWRSINGAESWDANPWVWRVEFYRRDGEA